MLFVAFYVDDLIFTGNNGEMIQEFESTMSWEFEKTNLGLMNFFFGLEIRLGDTIVSVSHETYANEIFKKYKIA